MITEYWARHYDDLRLSGRADEEEHEDEDFDLEALMAQAAADPDGWVDLINDGGAD
jgi:hypothetical protein